MSVEKKTTQECWNEFGMFVLFVEASPGVSGEVNAWVSNDMFDEDPTNPSYPTFNLAEAFLYEIEMHTNSYGEIDEDVAQNIECFCEKILKELNKFKRVKFPEEETDDQNEII